MPRLVECVPNVSEGQRRDVIDRLAKSIRDISGADVISMSANVENGRISSYKTTVNIAFAVEGTN